MTLSNWKENLRLSFFAEHRATVYAVLEQLLASGRLLQELREKVED